MLKVLVSLKTPDKGILSTLKGYDVEILDHKRSLAEAIAKTSYDLVIIDGGLLLLSVIKEIDPRTEIILIDGGGTGTVEAVRGGATACFSAPVNLRDFRATIDDIERLCATRRETGELERLLGSKYIFAGIVGRNPEILDIISFIRRIAPYYKVATITGETGTGKELLAKALHTLSPVGAGPFVVCNCGAIVEGLIESELFGHVRGAFTGAIKDKQGLFEVARQGTILLDEISELPLSAQPHLLRVLQDGEFRKVGSNKPLKTDCRVIAATNKNLLIEVQSGRFREDLYYRLTPLTITLPPLRERKDDIPLLLKHLVERFSQRTGKIVLGVSRPAQISVMLHDWPGNIRELENVIEQAAMLTTEPFIRPADLPQYLRETRHHDMLQQGSLEEANRNHIRVVLEQCNGNRTEAAKILKISRRALGRKIEKYNLR